MSQIPLIITQGSTFSKVLRWAQPAPTFKPITGITKAAPPVITAVAHGLPDGWPVYVQNVLGMVDINDPDNPRRSAVLTDDTLSLPYLDATGYAAYVSGGVLKYFAPVSLDGFTARAQVRSSRGATTTLLELTTENSQIVLDDTEKTIALTLSAAVTTALTFTRGVWSLEMVSGTGVVTQIVPESPVSVVREVTR